MIVFITLPFVAFFLGMSFGEQTLLPVDTEVVTQRSETIHPIFYVVTGDGNAYIIDSAFEALAFKSNHVYIDNAQFTRSIKAYLYNADGIGAVYSTSRIIIDNGTDEKTIDFGTEVVSDWLLTRDGASIFAIAQDRESDRDDETYAVYKIDTNTLGRTTIGSLTLRADIAQPMVELSNGEIILIEDSIGKGSEFAVRHTIFPELSDVGVKINNGCETVYCSLGYISPNGEWVLWKERGGKDLANFYYQLRNLTNGFVNRIVSVETGTDQPHAAYWSPDSNRIAYKIGQYGQDDIQREDKVNIYTVADKSTKTVYAHETTSYLVDYEKNWFDNVSLLGWLPDNKHVVVRNENTIKIINVDTKEVIETGVHMETGDFIQGSGRL